MSKPPPIPLIQIPDWIAAQIAGAEMPGVEEGSTSGESVDGDLLVVDDVTAELFDEESMEELVGLEIAGGDSPALNEAMEELTRAQSPERVEELLEIIVRERGGELSHEEAREQYDKFVQVRAAAAARGEAIGEPIPQVNEVVHGDFLGSTASLRFGKVVGEAFGIDPVFGAMLSPTGGMVGPGNWAIHPGDDDPTGYHGIVHDAAGYLYNYHGEGPGYDYLDREDRDTANPLTGQQSGMRYWHEKLNPGTATDVKLLAIDAVATTYDGAVAAIDYVESGAEAAYDTASDVVSWVGDGLESAGEAAYETVSEGYDYASDKVDEAIDFLSDLVD